MTLEVVNVRITRNYMELENMGEVHMHDVSRNEYYKLIPQEFDVDEFPYPKLMSNIPLDIHVLTPNDGQDFIIMGVGQCNYP